MASAADWRSDDATISWTWDGVITTWNRGAEKMYGYTAAEIVGRPMAILLTPDHAGYEALVLNPIARGERVNQIETVRLHKDGRASDMSLVASPIRDASNTITGGWAIARDIAECKQIDRMKSEFISTVSHELRTPLTSIRGALGLVTGGVTGTMSPQAQTMLDIAYKNSERLVRLINNILDIEKIEAGKMTVHEQVVELTPLVEQALEANQSYAKRFGVSYVLSHVELGVQVNGNAARLLQVLTNLLANAAKFSQANGTVEVSVVRREEWCGSQWWARAWGSLTNSAAASSRSLRRPTRRTRGRRAVPGWGSAFPARSWKSTVGRSTLRVCPVSALPSTSICRYARRLRSHQL